MGCFPLRVYILDSEERRKKRKSFLKDKLMKFRIRLDCVDGAEGVLKHLHATSQEYVWVKHDVNDNPHYHMYLDNPNLMSPQSVRYYFKKLTENSSDYSVKRCDDDRVSEYVQYLFNTKHGNISTLISHKFNSQLLDECRQAAEVVSQEFAKKRSTKKGAITMYEIAMEVHETYKDSNDLIKGAIRTLHKYLKIHDDFLVMKVVTTVMSLRDEDIVVERIRRKLLS